MKGTLLYGHGCNVWHVEFMSRWPWTYGSGLKVVILLTPSLGEHLSQEWKWSIQWKERSKVIIHDTSSLSGNTHENDPSSKSEFYVAYMGGQREMDKLKLEKNIWHTSRKIRYSHFINRRRQSHNHPIVIMWISVPQTMVCVIYTYHIIAVASISSDNLFQEFSAMRYQ